MYDAQRTHPLLAQIPLVVSPFVTLPSAVTLPYTFRGVATSLPASLLTERSDEGRPKYVISSSGHAAHPDDIIAACKTLQQHIDNSAREAVHIVDEWEHSIKERELAERRRVAPGWLDREEKLLEPTKAGAVSKDDGNLLDRQSSNDRGHVGLPVMSPSREGEELDRAFGGLGIK